MQSSKNIAEKILSQNTQTILHPGCPVRWLIPGITTQLWGLQSDKEFWGSPRPFSLTAKTKDTSSPLEFQPSYPESRLPYPEHRRSCWEPRSLCLEPERYNRNTNCCRETDCRAWSLDHRGSSDKRDSKSDAQVLRSFGRCLLDVSQDCRQDLDCVVWRNWNFPGPDVLTDSIASKDSFFEGILVA